MDRAKDIVTHICERVASHGGRALVVGGWVRDHILDVPGDDYDIEVYGIEPQRLLELLGEQHELDLVGASFGVIKLKGLTIDVSIPRRDSKVPDAGTSGRIAPHHGPFAEIEDELIAPHRAFVVASDPHMSVREAARRRDFTINTISYDPLTHTYEDPFDGRADLEKKVLRHTSEEFFADDPLRVLRGMQFVARFNLSAAPETVALCRGMDLTGLSAERLMGEWSKLLLKGVLPSRGLAFLRDSKQLAHYPELTALIDCPQDPEWHPEGDVWVHTGHCLDFFAQQRTRDRYEDLVVGMAVLCHDLGKPATTRQEDGRWRAKRHAGAGLAPTTTFVQRLTSQKNLLEEVLPLVKYHLLPRELFDIQAGDAALRRLARRVGRIDRLARVSAADAMGRPPLSQWETERLACEWLVRRAQELAVLDAAPAAFLLGRHLLELGMSPGPGVGVLLAACYEAQLDGQVTSLEEATGFARAFLAESKAKKKQDP